MRCPKGGCLVQKWWALSRQRESLNLAAGICRAWSPFSLILLGIRHDSVPREKDFHWTISTSTVPIPKLLQKIALGPVRRAGSGRDGSSCRCAAPSSAFCSFPYHCLSVWAGGRLSPLLHLYAIAVLKWRVKSSLESEQSVDCGACLHR